MKFDKSRVYTALNADELKPGSEVILADFIGALKNSVCNNLYITTLKQVFSEDHMYRFLSSDDTEYALAYLVEEPQALKWSDLKLGDIIENKINQVQHMITSIYTNTGDGLDNKHLFYAGDWQSDEYLSHFTKVEK